jgi:glycerophosphoryl diester phosphodiesterase
VIGVPARAEPLRLAHRGDWRHGPENSLAAFRAALALPTCDGLEFDVRHSRDAIPVILHDETLARVQGRNVRADRLSAFELAELGVPTLEAVLALVPAAAFLDVELKEDVGQPVVDVLAAARGASLSDAVVSSFEHSALKTIGRLAPAWPRWLNAVVLGADSIALALDLGCAGVSAEWHSIDERAMDAARAADLAVAAWTVRRRATAHRLGRLGVVAICVEGAALDG